MYQLFISFFWCFIIVILLLVSIKLFRSNFFNQTFSINTSTELNFPKKAPAGYKPKQQTLSVRNTIGYRGVSSNKCKGYKVVNYQAQITLGGCHVYIGNYDTILEGKSIFNYPPRRIKPQITTYITLFKVDFFSWNVCTSWTNSSNILNIFFFLFHFFFQSCNCLR